MGMIEERLHNLSGGDVLDVATGRGGAAVELAGLLKDYRTIIGVDFVHAAVAEAVRKQAENTNGGPEIQFACMDAARLGFPDASFDLTLMVSSLHHLADINASLAEMYRVTRPGGRIMVWEMVRDGLNEPQITHKLLHHWWASIDRRAGIIHNETLSKAEILDHVGCLGLRDLEVYEQDEPMEDPFDEKLIGEMTRLIEEYPAKIPDHSDREQLVAEGEQLKRRLREVGLAWATGLAVIGMR